MVLQSSEHMKPKMKKRGLTCGNPTIENPTIGMHLHRRRSYLVQNIGEPENRERGYLKPNNLLSLLSKQKRVVAFDCNEAKD